MTKNTLLNIAIVICKFSRILCVVVFLILTGAFVHYQINPSSYENSNFKTNINDSATFFKITSTDKINVDGEVLEDSDVFAFSKLKTSSLYFNYIKLSVVLYLIFLCVKEFQNLIESVKEIKTFQKRNISTFKKIGKYFLILTVLMSYTSYTYKEGNISSFQLLPTPLILALLSYIMSEIFKEGYKLSEENKLTV